MLQKLVGIFSLTSLFFAAHSMAEPSEPVWHAQGWVFSKDARPVDGALTEISITRKTNTYYTATMHVAFYDRIHHTPVERTEVLGDNLLCKAAYTDARDLSRLECSRDLRPVDGALFALTFLREDAAFKVTKRVSYYDRIHGGEVNKSTELASGLRLK